MGEVWITLADRLASNDGTAWTTHRLDPGGDAPGQIEVGEDGTVWVVVERHEPPGLTVLRMDAEGRAVTIPLDSFVPAGGGSPWLAGLAPTPDGWAWLGVASHIDGTGDARLLRVTDGGAQVVDAPDGIDLAGMTSLDRGADGTLWVYLEDRGDGPSWVRFGGDRWEAVNERVPHKGAPGAWTGGVSAAPDGSVWVTVADDPGGLAHFDGWSWARHAAGHWFVEETSIDVGPDGTLWVSEDGTVFRIRP